MKEEQIFKRYEVKYLLSEEQYKELRRRTAGRLTEDAYGESEICNCYYDTPDYRLIRHSLEKGIYKEKLRLRSYGVPEDAQSKVFLELKKKFDGVVYKRREAMTYAEAMKFAAGKRPSEMTQIMREIDWTFHFYPELKPKMFLSYKRTALFEGDSDSERGGKTHTGNLDLRVTFDRDIRWRTDGVDLESGIYGSPILEEGYRIMEVKCPGAMPLWFAEILTEMKVYPASFSKYGKAYEAMIRKTQKQKIA